MKEFNKEFNYFDKIDIKYTPDNEYTLYQLDLWLINSGNVPTSMIQDTRFVSRSKK